MSRLNEILQTPLVVLGRTTITLGQLVYVVGLLLLGSIAVVWSARLIRSRLQRRDVSPDVVQMVSRAYLIFAFAILAISTLDQLRVPLTAFAFVSGAIAIGVGFGAQNIINNFISGWILMWERPIRIGDFLEVGEMKGNVEAINTRSTRIRRVDGVHILVPNSQLLENTVTNWTLVDDMLRTTVRVGVAYGSPVQRVTELIQQAVDEQSSILKKPPREVIFDDFGDNSLNFEVYFWVHSAADRGLRRIRSDVRYRIDELFRENKIVIAFPQRDVHLDGEIRLKRNS